jgi:hypothetical protein
LGGWNFKRENLFLLQSLTIFLQTKADVFKAFEDVLKEKKLPPK